MSNSLFIIVTFVFFIILIVFFIAMTVWGTTPVGITGPGANCQITSDCDCGLTCQGGTCVIPKQGSCSGNNQYCEIGTVCLQDVCVPLVIPTPSPNLFPST